MSDDRPAPKSFERDYVPPRVQRDLARIFDLLNWLLSQESTAGLVRHASSLVDDQAAFASACERVAEDLAERIDTTVVPKGTLYAYVEWVSRRLASQDPAPPYPLRLGRLWDLPVRAIYVALEESDVATIREQVKPGQIWINATDLEPKNWPLVGSWLQSQRRLLGKEFGHPGRKPWRDDRRDRVAVEVAQAPTSAEAWTIVRNAGLRVGPLYDPSNKKTYPANKQFLARLRARGEKLLRS